MTPRTPQAAATQTPAVGRSCKSGQESRATQIGKVFVSVKTSETGSRVSAKKVQTRLMLPAMLRSHNVGGLQTTKRTPAASPQAAARTSASVVRASAITCQSHCPPSALASVAMTAKARLPSSIHK